MPAARRLAKIERGSLGVTPKFLIDNQFERVNISNDGVQYDGARISASKHASRESNRFFQQTPLISTARSYTAEIDPSWEIRALAAELEDTLACNGASRDAPLCANPPATAEQLDYRFLHAHLRDASGCRYCPP